MLFTIRGNGIIVSWYRKTINYSPCFRNDNNESSEEEILEVSLGEESCGHKSLETRQCYLRNCGGREICGHRYKYISHSTSINSRGREHRSSVNIHSASRNHG